MSSASSRKKEKELEKSVVDRVEPNIVGRQDMTDQGHSLFAGIARLNTKQFHCLRQRRSSLEILLLSIIGKNSHLQRGGAMAFAGINSTFVAAP